MVSDTLPGDSLAATVVRIADLTGPDLEAVERAFRTARRVLLDEEESGAGADCLSKARDENYAAQR